jgi:hypothetical protein
MRPRDLFLSAALAAIAWTPSLSQSNPQPTPRFGIIGGANLATQTGYDASNRLGFAGGLMAVLPVSPSFAIQPELMFTRKGATSKLFTTSATSKFDYIELPVLARFEIPAFGRVKPFVYGGPGFAYRTSCTLGTVYGEGVVQNGVPIFSETAVITQCDSLASQLALAGLPGVKVSSTDVDGIIGAGLAFDVGGRTMTVGARYDVGFVKLFTDSNSKNRALSFMGTLEWPFHK